MVDEDECKMGKMWNEDFRKQSQYYLCKKNYEFSDTKTSHPVCYNLVNHLNLNKEIDHILFIFEYFIISIFQKFHFYYITTQTITFFTEKKYK